MLWEMVATAGEHELSDELANANAKRARLHPRLLR
jgi:hypothetical protein